MFHLLSYFLSLNVWHTFFLMSWFYPQLLQSLFHSNIWYFLLLVVWEKAHSRILLLCAAANISFRWESIFEWKTTTKKRRKKTLFHELSMCIFSMVAIAIATLKPKEKKMVHFGLVETFLVRKYEHMIIDLWCGFCVHLLIHDTITKLPHCSFRSCNFSTPTSFYIAFRFSLRHKNINMCQRITYALHHNIVSFNRFSLQLC